MDMAHQSQTPTTPAFPQDPSSANSSDLQATARMPISPPSSDRRSDSINARFNTSSSLKSPAAVSNGTTATTTTEMSSPHPQPALYARRALRRSHERTKRSLYQAHLYRQFVHLLRPLQPLVSIETGLSHPYFPQNMLQYHLLSHAQLDALAEHYHQSTPSYYSLGYPTSVVGRWGVRSLEEEELMVRDQHFEALMEEARGVSRKINADDLNGAMVFTESASGSVVAKKEEEEERRKAEEIMIENKRRRFGRFIGLRDCESPGVEDEGVMERAMEAWIWGEVERRMRLEGEWELGIGKGGW